MTSRYLLLTLALAWYIPADGAEPIDSADLKTILQEAAAALKISAAPQDILADLKSKTYGKQVSVSEAGITDLREMDTLPVNTARCFSGVYTIDGKSYPEPSSLDANEIAASLRGLLTHATWRPDLEKIGCSGAGLVVLNVKEGQTTLTYNLLASSYNFRRLRLGQLVSLEATISGVCMKNGNLNVYGVVREILEP